MIVFIGGFLENPPIIMSFVLIFGGWLPEPSYFSFQSCILICMANDEMHTECFKERF